MQQNSAIPDYLPEEDNSPEREVDRAISRTTAKNDASGSWLSSAASFLSKTFYWWDQSSSVLWDSVTQSYAERMLADGCVLPERGFLDSSTSHTNRFVLFNHNQSVTDACEIFQNSNVQKNALVLLLMWNGNTKTWKTSLVSGWTWCWFDQYCYVNIFFLLF